MINGSVYDLTEWIHKHPGSAHGILELCGIDGTHEFMDEHAGFADAMKTLDKYKIGELGKWPEIQAFLSRKVSKPRTWTLTSS